MSALPLCQKPISTDPANSTVKLVGDNTSYHLSASKITGLVVVVVVTFSFVLIGALLYRMRRSRRKVNCFELKADSPYSYQLAGEQTKERLPSRRPQPTIVPVNTYELNCESSESRTGLSPETLSSHVVQRARTTFGAKEYHEMDANLPANFTDTAGVPRYLATCQELEAQQDVEMQNSYEARNQATGRQRTEERRGHYEQVWQSSEGLKDGDYEKTNATFTLDTSRGDIGEEVEDGLSRSKLASPLRLPNNTKDAFSHAEFSNENRVVQSRNDSTEGNHLIQADSTRASTVGNSDMRRPVKRKGSRELGPNFSTEVQKPRQAFRPPQKWRKLLPQEARIQVRRRDSVYEAQNPEQGFDGRKDPSLSTSLANPCGGLWVSTNAASNSAQLPDQIPSSSPLYYTVGTSESPNQLYVEKQPSALSSPAFQYQPTGHHYLAASAEPFLEEGFRGGYWSLWEANRFQSQVHLGHEHQIIQLTGQNWYAADSLPSEVESPEVSPGIASSGMSSGILSPDLSPGFVAPGTSQHSARLRASISKTPSSQSKDSAEHSQKAASPSLATSPVRKGQQQWFETGQEATAPLAADMNSYSPHGNTPIFGYQSV